jgi:hypothetical protein
VVLDRADDPPERIAVAQRIRHWPPRPENVRA